MNPQLAAFFAFVRRFPYPTCCVVLILACGGGAWWLRGEVDALQAQHADRAKEGEAMLTLLVGGSTQRQELANVRAATRRIEEHLVEEGNLAENLWYFFKLEDQMKVRLEVHQLSSPLGDSSTLFKRVPYSLRVNGTYEQLEGFLLALETGPQLVNITAFSCGRREPNSLSLTLDLTVELLGKK